MAVPVSFQLCSRQLFGSSESLVKAKSTVWLFGFHARSSASSPATPPSCKPFFSFEPFQRSPPKASIASSALHTICGPSEATATGLSEARLVCWSRQYRRVSKSIRLVRTELHGMHGCYYGVKSYSRGIFCRQILKYHFTIGPERSRRIYRQHHGLANMPLSWGSSAIYIRTLDGQKEVQRRTHPAV